ncbi:hypothetical protein [Hoeflea sp.]|uniref:hypothetical protein n=1 Tax=Hoeflea sp. TaxID=1940281 RepID=UPI00199EEEF7|nr:hypothetical protein [Hoeflea sp.]MBC7284539.1 hypothetical protein [Hoeflea sp.]
MQEAAAQTSTIPAFLPDANAARTGQDDSEDASAANDEDGETDPLEANEQPGFQAFKEHMANWQNFASQYVSEAKTTHRKTVEVSPSQLARIAERMHDQLLSLDEEITSAWKTGHILHRQITNVLHALIVSTSGSTGRLASPKSSDRPLVEALRSATDNDDLALHPLAAIVLACPLVWAFLNPNEYYSASGTKSDKLRDEVEAALRAFQNKCGSEDAQFEPIWLSPPEISIAIGRAKAAKPRMIKQKGFFDVLNVVPRYYPKASAPK